MAGCRVFTYHAVEETPRDRHAVTSELLRLHVSLLMRRGWRSVPVEAIDQLVRGLRVGSLERTFLLTFDDGYAGTLLTALPILEAHRCNACVFVTTDHVGGTDVFNGSGVDGRRMLDWSQVRELVRRGVGIGSHGCSHRALSMLSPNEAEREIIASKDRLEAELGRSIDYFAYPFGEVNLGLERIVEKAGYRAAFAGPAGRGSRYCIPRVAVGGRDSRLRFLAKLSSLYLLASRWRRNRHLPGMR